MAINKTVNKSTKSHGAMRNCIEYVLQEKKISDGLVYMTGPSPEVINWNTVYQTFLEEKKIWNKDSGRLYNHNIISFAPDEQISPEQALEFGKEFAEKWFPNHQTLISVHQDRHHVHMHFVTNTVSYIDGMKLHNSRADLQKMKDFTNEMCMGRGLSIAEKGRHFDGTEIEEGTAIAWSNNKYHMIVNDEKKSYVVDCAIAVMEVKETSCNREEFERGMEERGWHVTWTDNKKHITFENDSKEKVRDSNLSKTFSLDISKEALLHEFERQNEIRLAKLESDRDRDVEREREEQLDRYYAEVEAAIQGDGVVGEAIRDNSEITDTSENVEFRYSNIKEQFVSGEINEQEFGKSIEGQRIGDTEEFIRNIRTEISDGRTAVRNSRTENRAIESKESQSNIAEQQSIASAEQRRIEEQQRIDAESRAKKIARKTHSHSGPSL